MRRVRQAARRRYPFANELLLVFPDERLECFHRSGGSAFHASCRVPLGSNSCGSVTAIAEALGVRNTAGRHVPRRRINLCCCRFGQPAPGRSHFLNVAARPSPEPTLSNARLPIPPVIPRPSEHVSSSTLINCAIRSKSGRAIWSEPVWKGSPTETVPDYGWGAPADRYSDRVGQPRRPDSLRFATRWPFGRWSHTLPLARPS